ncbi:polyhydroxyalkanoate synthase [Sphingomonas gellani]|uniref:Polyhydroxyalkanoate synthase n=1 Tax=Sphingomonas gellani TaxID=1166340 RepID=A0A1H8CAF9_9SPHN|nr:alpha/beta fold hydrolase [Sphingomonas gellani]SEM92026.1 polyhydroxyalkanoate synthase [Sphingomonas gellani]
MADDTDAPRQSPPNPPPSLADLQHWTWVMGRAQQMMMEAGLEWAKAMPDTPPEPAAGATALSKAGDFWSAGMRLWQQMLDPEQGWPGTPASATADDKRFRADAWHDNPYFDWVRRSYLALSDHMLAGVDALEGVDPAQRERLRFATRAVVDAISPANFPGTNPEVIQRAVETGGESLLKGLANMLADLGRGQLTHGDRTAFEVGRNLATTPGKVVYRTPLFELIHYAPTTERVLDVPLVIFPPWINRFYILDLTPEKSFVRWAVEQGVSVFMVSWKSAGADSEELGWGEVSWDDYVLAQVEAVDTIRNLLGVPAVHAIGYCVAGTTLAATLAWLAARGEGGKIASATFFTAQVDFSGAGDLKHFVDDEQLALIGALSPEGFLDGRYMAATFNLLRGRDLIWNYVTNNYLLGKDYAPFDLLHWNGDTTNLPARWHLGYLTDLYRDNLLVKPGAMSVAGTPLDLTRVDTPAYVQAGREDHIAPPESVWRITESFRGPLRFVLAGSGHIAGVVNPPAAGKYGYWTSDTPAETLDAFVASAREVRGSWWPDWMAWLRARSPGETDVSGARIPGGGTLPALEDAPGSYVRMR